MIKPTDNPAPTRWLRRILLALLAACLAWWSTRELTKPQPLLSFPMDDRILNWDTIQVGQWLIIQSRVRLARSSFSDEPLPTVQIYDLKAKTFKPCEPLSGFFEIPQLHIDSITACLDRYVIQLENSRTITVHDTTTSKEITHRFPVNSTQQISVDGSTVLQSTTLPVAPFAALSPAPLSALPAALLMSVDTQRCYRYALGPTLVQVRQLPDMKVTKRYALPLHADLRFLKLSANGKYLLHGFAPDNPPCLPRELFSSQGNTPMDEVLPLLPDDKRIWEHVLTMFPDHSHIYLGWSKRTKERGSRLKQRLRVPIDLTGIWPELSNSFDVYDTHTGQLHYTTRLEENGKPVEYRCMRQLHDWAFLSAVRPTPGDITKDRALPPFCALHLPTGRKIPAAQLPAAYWSTYGGFLVPGPSNGHAMSHVLLSTRLPSPYSPKLSPDAIAQQLYRFLPDGSHQLIAIYGSEYWLRVIPHSNQIVLGDSLSPTLPKWLQTKITLWPWLARKLQQPLYAVIDTDTNATLWRFAVIDSDDNNNNPHPIISTDGRLLILPTTRENNQVIYQAYRLPLSPWRTYWPPILSAITLLFLLSQGIRRLRFLSKK